MKAENVLIFMAIVCLSALCLLGKLGMDILINIVIFLMGYKFGLRVAARRFRKDNINVLPFIRNNKR